MCRLNLILAPHSLLVYSPMGLAAGGLLTGDLNLVRQVLLLRTDSAMVNGDLGCVARAE